MGGAVGNIMALKKYLTRSRRQKTCDYIDEGGFPGAIRPNDRFELVGSEFQVDIIIGYHSTKMPIQVFCTQDSRHGISLPFSGPYEVITKADNASWHEQY
jgi:hypothetical protein